MGDNNLFAMTKVADLNVFGEPLKIAGTSPMTGFFRNGYCCTGTHDVGSHVVAAVVTDAFLNYSKQQGNDLISPNPAHNFPGLKAGDIWCLCSMRWKEALAAGVAPLVILEATHIRALEIVSIEQLTAHAFHQPQ